MSYSALLLVAVTSIITAYGQLEPICTSSAPDPNDPPLPQLPDQYSLTIEANLVERNMTVTATEYFDSIGNRGRIEFTRNGMKTTSIVDYNLREAFVFPNPITGDDCTVSLVNPSGSNSPVVRFLFGVVPGANGTVHIGSPSFFFGLGNATNFTHLGMEDIRGVPCHHWQTCTNRPNASYTLDYYFTSSDLWTSANPNANDLIPVLITLSGSIVNRTTGEVYSTEHYYSIVGFNSGPDSIPADVFNVPLDLICKGRLPGQPLPTFTNVYSVTSEFLTSLSPVVFTIKFYYDVGHQLVRVDGTNPTINGPYQFIQDFNTAAQYFINSSTSQCMVMPLNRPTFDTTMDGDSDLHIASTAQLLHLTSNFNYTYEGVTTIRGFMADVWISPRPFDSYPNRVNVTDGAYLIYMTRPGQVFSTVYGVTTNPVLVHLKYTGVAHSFTNGTYSTRNFTNHVSMFDFSDVEPPLDVYDISPCINRSTAVTVKFLIRASQGPPMQIQFRSSVRSAFMQYAKSIGQPFVSPLQITNIQVIPSSVSGMLLVSVDISNPPANGTVRWPYSAKKLVDRLTAGLNNNDPLPISISTGSGSITSLYYDESSATCQGAVDTGVTVGVAIGVFIVGLVIGLLVSAVFCFVFSRMKGGSSGGFADLNNGGDTGRYKPQVNEEGFTEMPPVDAD